MAKFMRNYLITWYDLSKGNKILIGDTNWQAKEGWSYPNLLTINMDVRRDTFASSNECHLQIFNLGKDRRQQMFHDRFNPAEEIYLEIMAGYGQNLSLIFRGRVLQSYSYMQGNDMITDIEALDIGFMSYIKDGRHVNYTSMTLEAGTSKREAIERIAADMEDESQLGALGAIGNVQYQTPVSFLGNSIFTIDQITGGHVFVDLGRVNVLSDKETIDVGYVPLISAETGLLGTPMRRGGQLELDILFEPSYIVGQAVKLETVTGVSEFNGAFKVLGVHHSGVISAADCGTLKTRLNLWYGAFLPDTNNALVPVEQEFSKVRGADILPMDGDMPQTVVDVYNYIQKYGRAPHSRVPNTTIYWHKLIHDGDYPLLGVIGNLFRVCQVAQQIANKYFGTSPVIQVSSGFRNPVRNKNVGGSSTSLHLTGRAIDVTAIGSLKDFKKIYFMYHPHVDSVRELLLEGGCVHIGIDKKNLTHGRWNPRTNKVEPVRDR